MQDWQIEAATEVKFLDDIAGQQTNYYRDFVLAEAQRLAIPGKTGPEHQAQVKEFLTKPWQDGISEHREVGPLPNNTLVNATVLAYKSK